MNKKLIILGAGGHAKVAIETAQRCGYEPCAVYDDDESLIGIVCCILKIPGIAKGVPESCKVKFPTFAGCFL